MQTMTSTTATLSSAQRHTPFASPPSHATRRTGVVAAPNPRPLITSEVVEAAVTLAAETAVAVAATVVAVVAAVVVVVVVVRAAALAMTKATTTAHSATTRRVAPLLPLRDPPPRLPRQRGSRALASSHRPSTPCTASWATVNRLRAPRHQRLPRLHRPLVVVVVHKGLRLPHQLLHLRPQRALQHLSLRQPLCPRQLLSRRWLMRRRMLLLCGRSSKRQALVLRQKPCLQRSCTKPLVRLRPLQPLEIGLLRARSNQAWISRATTSSLQRLRTQSFALLSACHFRPALRSRLSTTIAMSRRRTRDAHSAMLLHSLALQTAQPCAPRW
jgi:hypothetical protein